MKKIVTKEKFAIEVEKEFEHLVYIDRLKKPEAKIKALAAVKEKYVIDGSEEAKSLTE